MRKIAFGILAILAGCTVSTTPNGSSGTSGSGGGTSGGTLCVMACAKLDALMCSASVQGDCATHCGIPPSCKVQEDAFAQCILDSPVACDASGNASTSSCNAEGSALLACVFPDGGIP